MIKIDNYKEEKNRYSLKIKFNILVFTLISIFLITISINSCNCVLLERSKDKTTTLPIYQINLDLPVSERYAAILIRYKKYIKALVFFSWKNSIFNRLTEFSKLIIQNKLENFDPELIEYIKAVRLHAKVSLPSAILISTLYDMACTSVVAQNTKTGNIFMGRNLDFINYIISSRMIFEAHYYKEGKYLFKAIELAGVRGIINGIKENKFSVSLNLRRKNCQKSNIKRVFQGYITAGYYLYKVLLEANSYEDAVRLYSSNIISAPAYFIVSGVNKNEGIIIERDFDKVENIENLDVDNGKWFILICNKDLNKEDDIIDIRRKVTKKRLQKIGSENINFTNFFKKVMSTYPNNNMYSIFTTMQTAQNDGFFNTTVWLH